MQKQKLEVIPFKELLVSRDESMENILKRISLILGCDANDGRILINDQNFYGLKAKMTI
jgi:hypothetical protein